MAIEATETIETLLGVNTDGGNTRLGLANSIVSGLPVSALDRLADAAAKRISPSTQPPETEPSKRPSAFTSIWLPRGRGADPQVETMVASTNRSPRQARAVSRMRSMSSN